MIHCIYRGVTGYIICKKSVSFFFCLFVFLFLLCFFFFFFFFFRFCLGKLSRPDLHCFPRYPLWGFRSIMGLGCFGNANICLLLFFLHLAMMGLYTAQLKFSTDFNMFFRVCQTNGNLVRRQWIDVKFDVMCM